MATSNKGLEVLGLLQDKAYKEEAPEDTSGAAMMQEGRSRRGEAKTPNGQKLFPHTH